MSVWMMEDWKRYIRTTKRGSWSDQGSVRETGNEKWILKISMQKEVGDNYREREWNKEGKERIQKQSHRGSFREREVLNWFFWIPSSPAAGCDILQINQSGNMILHSSVMQA